MKIATKGRYAIEMLIDLAEHKGEGFIALKDIAKRQDISKKYLEQISIMKLWNDLKVYVMICSLSPKWNIHLAAVIIMLWHKME